MPALLRSLASVRQVFASGEALTPSHVRKFNDIWGSRTGARLTNLYGPTEATVDVSYFDCPAHNDFESIPIGRPIHNTRLYVIKDGQQVAIGEAGELCIAGVGLARGYLNNPALTAEKFIDNPVNPGERIYRTGDVARGCLTAMSSIWDGRITRSRFADCGSNWAKSRTRSGTIRASPTALLWSRSIRKTSS